jgi:hypothetical protein
VTLVSIFSVHMASMTLININKDYMSHIPIQFDTRCRFSVGILNNYIYQNYSEYNESEITVYV